jgi:hypothetical protein
MSPDLQAVASISHLTLRWFLADIRHTVCKKRWAHRPTPFELDIVKA